MLNYLHTLFDLDEILRKQHEINKSHRESMEMLFSENKELWKMMHGLVNANKILVKIIKEYGTTKKTKERKPEAKGRKVSTKPRVGGNERVY